MLGTIGLGVDGSDDLSISAPWTGRVFVEFAGVLATNPRKDISLRSLLRCDQRNHTKLSCEPHPREELGESKSESVDRKRSFCALARLAVSADCPMPHSGLKYVLAASVAAAWAVAMRYRVRRRSPMHHITQELTLSQRAMTRASSQTYAVNPLAATSEHVVIAMVGLPARGKSYMSKAIVRYLNYIGCPCKIFNAGNKRRKSGLAGTAASFFDGRNAAAQAQRDNMAMETLDDLFEVRRAGTCRSSRLMASHPLSDRSSTPRSAASWHRSARRAKAIRGTARAFAWPAASSTPARRRRRYRQSAAGRLRILFASTPV